MTQNERPDDEASDLPEVEDAMSEAAGDTLKVPDEAEAEPANVEGSEARLPEPE